jgi:hypothetical protein
LNNVAFALPNVSLTPFALVIILKLTNLNSGAHVCDVTLDVDAFAISDTHSIGVIRSGEGIYFRADQLQTIAYCCILLDTIL